MTVSSERLAALAKKLDTSLAGLSGEPLSVIDVSESSTGDLVVCVRLRNTMEEKETWALRFTLDEHEFNNNTLETLWLIYRANIEEWLNLYETDPQVRRWGTRID